jgi:hypothetical protein
MKRSLDLPGGLRSAKIVPDMDDTGGVAAARALAWRLSRQGCVVRIAPPPQGLDLNDVLTGKTAEDVAS